MPMKNKVTAFLEERGITAYQFIKDTGISENTGYGLNRDPNHLPSIKVIRTICDTYKIQPNDILEWVKS